ncbi:MAG: DUF1801 domain-containing protein [Pseudomonadota bacterium]
MEKGENTLSVPADVRAVMAAYPAPARALLAEVRALLFDVAAEVGAGPLAEVLKWGEPAYLTTETGSGSTVRLAVKDGRPAAFFICTTGLVDGFRSDFPELSYQGNRGIWLDENLDKDALAQCLARALTYHRAKKARRM